MTIGLVLLGIVILLIFFGAAERFFRNIGIPNWLAFLLVLALVVGAVVPNITIGTFSMNVSGFLIPIAIMVLFQVLIGWNGELLRSLIAEMSVAGVVVMVRMLITPSSQAMIITTSLIIGFVGGIVAYLVGQSRMPVIVATMGGIVIGDVIVNLVNRYALGGTAVSLGTGGVFNSIIIASITGLVLLEVVNAMLRAMNRKRLNRTALGFESAEDVYTEHEIKSDRLDEAELGLADDFEYMNYENYFNDDRLL